MEELLANGDFRVQTKWEAYDGAYVEAEFTKAGTLGGDEKKALAAGVITKAAYDAIYKKARSRHERLPAGW